MSAKGAKKGAKGTPVKEVKPPHVFTLGKDSTYFPGQWMILNGQSKKLGIPTTAHHRFFGDCKEDGSRHGQALEVVPLSHKFKGQYEDGARSGLGVLVTAKNSVYAGSFAGNRFSGNGKFILSSADVVEGKWNAGMLQGHVCARFANGMLYKGNFENSHITGHGRAEYADGSVYEGEWLNGMKHGKGSLTLPDGCRYTGDFSFDHEHGSGSVAFPSGLTFTGQWENGARVLESNLVSAESLSSPAHDAADIAPIATLASSTPSLFPAVSNNADTVHDAVSPFVPKLETSFVYVIPESSDSDTVEARVTLHRRRSEAESEYGGFAPRFPLDQRPPTSTGRPSSRMSSRERTRSLNSAVADRILRSMHTRAQNDDAMRLSSPTEPSSSQHHPRIRAAISLPPHKHNPPMLHLPPLSSVVV